MKVNDGFNDILTKVVQITKPFIDLLKEAIGDKGLYQLINCSFIADDTAILITTFKKSGNIFITVSACLASLGFLNWIILFFGLIYLFRKATKDKYVAKVGGIKAINTESKEDMKEYAKVDVMTDINHKIE